MKWSLVGAALLLVSLSLKLRAESGDPYDNAIAVTAHAAEALQLQGYQTKIGPSGLQIAAVSGNCRVAARMLDAHGTQLAFLSAALRPTGSLHYAWRGQWFAEPPRLLQLGQFYLVRELARQRLLAQRDPVWILAVSEGCPKPDLRFTTGKLMLMMDPPANLLRH